MKDIYYSGTETQWDAVSIDGAQIPVTTTIHFLSTGPDTDISKLDNVVYFNRSDGRTCSQIKLALQMKNVIAPTGFQCDIYLPEGMTFAKNTNDKYAELSTERTTATNTDYFDSVIQPDGALRILTNSTGNYTFTGNDGEVAKVFVNISEDMTDGAYPIYIRNIVLSDINSQTYKVNEVKSTIEISTYILGDANNDKEVNVGDFTAIASYILGTPPATFHAKAADVNCDGEINVGDITALASLILYGPQTTAQARSMRKTFESSVLGVRCSDAANGKEFAVDVEINGANRFSAYQFDVNIPAGFSFKTIDGEPCVSLCADRANLIDMNLFKSRMIENGRLRVLCASTGGTLFSGTAGAVARVILVADDTVSAGQHEMSIDNAVISESGNALTLAQKTFNVNVGGVTSIDGVDADAEDGEMYDLSGRVVKQTGKNLQKGIYIKNNKKVINK